MIPHPSFGTSLVAGSWFVSHDLAVKIQLGLEELAIVRDQFRSLISTTSNATVGVVEAAAACAMPHSFYIEKILKLIAREWDGARIRFMAQGIG